MNRRVGRSSWRATLILIFFIIVTACLTGCGENTNNEPSGVRTPANLTATGTQGPPPRIVLNWSASDGAVSYQIYRDGVPISPIRTGSQATDTNVVAHAWYCYSISATDASGHQSLRSDAVCTSTDAARIATMTATRGGLLGATLAAGETTVITANVTDGNGDPVLGETVTFTIPVNASGASFSSPCNALTLICGSVSVQVTTDSGGNAVAIYVAGDNYANYTVYDTVRAVLTNGSSNAVTITRNARPAGTVAGYSIAVASIPPTVGIDPAGGSTVVTATVQDGSIGMSGVTVDFVTVGGAVSPASATTDANGKAVTVFTAGAGAAGSPAGVVTASVTIGGNTYTAAVAITH
jgi:hypothetical protein